MDKGIKKNFRGKNDFFRNTELPAYQPCLDSGRLCVARPWNIYESFSPHLDTRQGTEVYIELAFERGTVEREGVHVIYSHEENKHGAHYGEDKIQCEVFMPEKMTWLLSSGPS